MSLLGTVIFWFVIIAASLSLCQLILQLAWKRWRFQWLYGLLDAPRLQFTLLSLSMAAVAWASVLVIRGEGGGGEGREGWNGSSSNFLSVSLPPQSLPASLLHRASSLFMQRMGCIQ